MELLKSFNSVDIFILVLAGSIIYSSFKSGFIVEFMKTLGTFLALFLAFHYYMKLSSFLSSATAMMSGVSAPVGQAVIFLFIWMFTLMVMKFARDGIMLVFTVQAISIVDRWGAVIVAIVRFFLAASMVMFVLLLTDQPYIERMTTSSFAQKHLLLVAPDTYQKIIKSFVAKLLPNEKVNPALIEELKEIGKK
jgi:uncharacterized membrane protein required for colicin V production